MPPLPPMPPRPDNELCRWHSNAMPMHRVAFLGGEGREHAGRLPAGLRICPHCDMGNPSAGPPVMLDYLRRGHQ